MLNKEIAMPATEICSPMPGKIAEILVKKGDAVLDGQELVILEAMKMETPVRSDRDGVIEEICIQVEDAVKNRQVLLTLS